MKKSDEELTKEEFHVCRQKGTEAPFSGKYNDFKEEGTFTCKCCGALLFNSNEKYDSGSGWPSFYDSSSLVEEHLDTSHFMVRTEITCKECGSHLGHVFDDGPEPTGKRYCVNSLSLDFFKKK